MVNWAVNTYKSIADAETAIELIANTVRVEVLPVNEDGKDKIVVLTGGNYV